MAAAFGWMVDGEAYFRAVRDVIGKAEREIVIVGWDIDSRLELIRDDEDPRYPSPLCESLQSLVDNNPDLHVYVLSWDFALVYVLEREFMPARSFGWHDSDQLHFKLDGKHAAGASHHQKLVIVDGAIAFCGGFDLTKNRWDTRRHAADDPRRIDPEGDRYRPFHDVQAVVTGAAADCLRQLASSRWLNATGETMPDLGRPGADAATRLWPEGVPVRARDVSTAIARTWSEPDGSEQIREVQDAYLDMIAAARQSIYIENQYFTSESVGTALAERLRSADSPEVVVVLPGETSGWLEQATMDILRNKILARLREADINGRLRVVSPVSDDLTDAPINVHSKIMIVDNRWARIGSANLSGRSMGLDTECDLIVDDDSAALDLCADLLAEHLDAEFDVVSDRLAADGLIAVLAEMNRGARRLERLETETGDTEQLVLEPLAKIADLEKPIILDPASTNSGNAGKENEEEMHTPLLGWAFLGTIVLIGALWVYWSFRGAGGDFDPQVLLRQLRELASHSLAPAFAIPAFIAGSLVVAPVTGMIAVCALLFDPWTASIVALAGTLAATVVNHWIGQHFSRAISARVPSRIANRISEMAQSSDRWSLAGLRLIPIAPFTIVNLVAGISGVGLRDFLVGTLIGMGPGIVLICLSVDRARAALAGEPVFDPWIIAAIAAAGIALIGLRAWQKRRGN